ncbi:MAG: hypothetical protein DRI95_14820 [Bacteroidetes bacterium]|nr:MAG: hypothetical protein DRI95_14820 [Bacteroidota bacterium]
MSTDFRGLDPRGLPLVSIVATCYNQESFLKETLHSIKAQIYPNIQLIIMDDCSQDESVDKIKEWIDRNEVTCKFISHTENKGICKTLNEALEYCEGKYYQAIACDDILFPDKIELQVQEFEKSDEDVMVIFSSWELINEFGNTIPRRQLVKYRDYTDYSDFFGEEFFGIIVAGSVLIRKKVFELIGNYDEELIAEDTDLWLRILEKYKIKYYDMIAFKYRRLNTSLTKTATKTKWLYRSIFKFLGKHLDNEYLTNNQINAGFKRYIKGLYVINNRTNWFKLIIKNKFSFFTCFHFMMATLGFTYHQAVRITKFLGVFIPG